MCVRNFLPIAYGNKSLLNFSILYILATEKVALADLEFPERKDTLVYLSYLSNIHWKIANLPPGSYRRRKVISCLEYLTVSVLIFKNFLLDRGTFCRVTGIVCLGLQMTANEFQIGYIHHHLCSFVACTQ